MALVLAAACDSDHAGRKITSLSGVEIERVENPVLVEHGARVYAQHCARCHGVNAEGHPRWRQRRSDGRYPPPPLNGSGHTWHHPISFLKGMIRNGSGTGGDMPAFGDTLDGADIEAVVAWFQSLWPDPVYAAWYEQVQYQRN